MTADSDWEDCARFHGHKCPGLAIGYRVAKEAARILGLSEASEDEDLVCISETDACGVDAIQCVLACTAGKGNLFIRMTGKHAFSFFDRRSGKSVRLVMKDFKRPGENERQRFMDDILAAPFGTLFTVGKPKHGLPDRARIYDSAVCSRCGEAFRSDMARTSGGKMFCVDCFPDSEHNQ